MNAADMHRVRMSLPFFKKLGWEVEIICVDEKYIEGYKDPLLCKTIPSDIIVHKIKAWPVKFTRFFGLGSLSLRSLYHFRKAGNLILKKNKFDLIFFSTTAFHVCWLGTYWKKKFTIPFIVDMQDPWRSDFYLDKPKSERPPKFFISYSIDKYLEAKTIPNADGIMSVSEGYCKTLLERYKNLKAVQCRVITFGGSMEDFKIMEESITQPAKILFDEEKMNFVYIGRGGYDLSYAIRIILSAFKKGLADNFNQFSKIHFYFIGTSYAAENLGIKTILPIATELEVDHYVTEITDRIPYFETLYLLKTADVLLLPGSIDNSYTASKIFPYILAQKQILAVFNKQSSIVKILQEMHFTNIIKFDSAISFENYIYECYHSFNIILNSEKMNFEIDEKAFTLYSAKQKAIDIVDFFNEVVDNKIVYEKAS